MRTSTLALLGALAIAAGCRPNLPPDKPLAPPLKTKGYFYTFPNGLRIVDYEDPRAKEFMLDVSVGIGGRDETDAQLGIAHLAEHMAFKGRPQGEKAPRVWERLLSSGVEFNAFTTEDNTDYFEIGRPDQFTNMLALEAERFRDPLANVTDADFQAEREVVVSEYRQRLETDPDGMQLSYLTQAVYAHHVYGREVAGDVSSLRSLKLDDVRAWYQAHYTPDNAVIVVTGPRPASEVIHLVGAMFGHLHAPPPGSPPIPPKARNPPPFPPEPPEAEPMIVKHAPIEQPVLWMAWTVPGVWDHEYPRGYAVATTLHQFLDQRLDKEDSVDDVQCFFEPNDGAGMVACRLQLEDEKAAPKVEEIVNDQLVEFVNHDFMVRYADAVVRGQMLSQLYLSVEQINAAPVAQYLRATGSPDYLGGFQQQILDTLQGDVGGYAFKYLNRKRTVALLVAPEKTVLVRVKDEAAPSVGESFDQPADSTQLDFTPEQIAALAGHPGLDQAERRTLSNGLKVVVAKRGTIPWVDARLIIDAPPSKDAKTRALAEVALSTSWRALNQDSQTHWPKVGAKPIQDFEGEHVVFGAEAMSGNLPHVLADMSTWVSDPSLDGHEFSEEARRAKANQAVEDQRPHDRAQALLMASLFPGHPYGVSPTAADYADLDASQGEQWLKQTLRPDRATLVITGEVEPSPELWDSIEAQLGSWKASGGALAPLPPVPALSARKLLFIDRPRATQAEITVALQMPRADAHQAAAMGVIRWYLGRHLMEVLREKQGVTYGVNPFTRGLSTADVLGVTTAVDQSAAGRAVKTILDEFQGLRDNPFDAQKLEQGRWQLARGYQMRFDQVSSAADALKSATERGYPADWFETFPGAIAQLSQADVQQTVKALHAGDEVVIVVGDKTTVLPQLRAAGYAVEEAPPLDAQVAKK